MRSIRCWQPVQATCMALGHAELLIPSFANNTTLMQFAVHQKTTRQENTGGAWQSHVYVWMDSGHGEVGNACRPPCGRQAQRQHSKQGGQICSFMRASKHMHRCWAQAQA